MDIALRFVCAFILKKTEAFVFTCALYSIFSGIICLSLWINGAFEVKVASVQDSMFGDLEASDKICPD